MRMLRTPSRASAKAGVWPHMPPPMISTSSAGLPSGPSTGGTQFGRWKEHALEVAPGGGRQLVEPGGGRAAGLRVARQGHRAATNLAELRAVSSSACIAARSPEPTLVPGGSTARFPRSGAPCRPGCRLPARWWARHRRSHGASSCPGYRLPPGVRMLGPSMAKWLDPRHHWPSMASARAEEDARKSAPAATIAAPAIRLACCHTADPSTFQPLARQASRIGRARQSA